MPSFTLGATSLARLAGVHPALVSVVKRAISDTEQDFMVSEGLRSAARQAALYAQGRTTPGPTVTWVTVSNHQAKADGFGHAVDLAAIRPDGSIEWELFPPYAAIKDAMFRAAAFSGVKLRWGADWNMNGVPREHGETDSPHFELHT